jgi:hypothetical protein
MRRRGRAAAAAGFGVTASTVVLHARPIGAALDQTEAATNQVDVAEAGAQLTQRRADRTGQVPHVVEAPRRHRAAHELLRDGGAEGLVDVRLDLGLPERVDVPREEADVADLLAPEVLGDQIALPHVAGPVVEVGVDTGVLGQVGAQRPQGRLVQVDQTQRADHHLVADELPGDAVLLRRPEAVEEPRALGVAEDGSPHRVHFAQRQVDRGAHLDRIAARALDLGVPVLACVEQRQVQEVAPPGSAVDPVAVDAHDRLVLEPRPVRGSGPLGEGQVGRAVAVVDELVVVPDGRERMRSVRRSQVGVGAVAPVLVAVRRQVGGCLRVDTDAERTGAAALRLVDVVAEEHHGVHVEPGDGAPGRVEAGAVALAAGDGEPDRVGRGPGGGQRARPADRARRASGAEAEPVGATGCQPLGEDLHAAVRLGRGDRSSLGDHATELGIRRHLPGDLDRGQRTCGETGPQHDPPARARPTPRRSPTGRAPVAAPHRRTADQVGRGDTTHARQPAAQQSPSIHPPPRAVRRGSG